MNEDTKGVKEKLSFQYDKKNKVNNIHFSENRATSFCPLAAIVAGVKLKRNA